MEAFEFITHGVGAIFISESDTGRKDTDKYGSGRKLVEVMNHIEQTFIAVFSENPKYEYMFESPLQEEIPA